MRRSLLVRHFLRRFFENDIISANADRREGISLAGGAMVSFGLIFTFGLCFSYMMETHQTPGRTAVATLDDHFFFIAASMLAMGLVAVLSWDALALEARDVAILGPLPVPFREVVRAKLLAVAIFAAGMNLALNAVPTVLYPSLMIGRLRVWLLGMLGLMGSHLLITSAASAFGFGAIVALREGLRAVLGVRLFARLSPILQGALIILLGTPLMVLPAVFWNVGGWWLSGKVISAFAVPPLWFLGLHEAIAGQIIEGLPRGDMPGRLPGAEQVATALYRGHSALFQQLAQVALVALAATVLLALAAGLWNNRRPPAQAPARRSGHSPVGAFARWCARTVVVRRPEAQAGFFFTLQTLWRSGPHRIALMTFVAAGLAIITVLLASLPKAAGAPPPAAAAAALEDSLSSPRPRALPGATPIPIGVFAIQFIAISVVILGVRQAMRIPAELRANWVFLLSWSGHENPYLAGARRAVLLIAGLPTVILLTPFYVVVLGPSLAVVHALAGLCLFMLLLELVLLGLDKLPFACSYVPEGGLMERGGIYAFMFVIATGLVASIERAVFGGVDSARWYVGVLVALVVAVKAVRYWRRRAPRFIDFNELPPLATQRFTLND